MTPQYIYIAGPYTKGDVVLNVRKAIETAEFLRGMGHIPFLPHLTHFWHLVYPHGVDYWYKYDLEWLKRCDCLIRLPGESTGADKEVEYAKEFGKPVYFGIDDWLER